MNTPAPIRTTSLPFCTCRNFLPLAIGLGWMAGAAALRAQTDFSQTVFTQNFDSAGSIADITGNGVNQFANTGNAAPANPASTYSILNGSLHYNRAADPVSGGTLASVQATAINFSGGAVTSAFRLDVGLANSAYNAAASGGGLTYNARFELNSGTAQAVGFTVRQGDTASNEFAFNSLDNSGKALGTFNTDVILFLNPTTTPLSYAPPVDGAPALRTLAPGTADAYFATFDADYTTNLSFALPAGFTSLQNLTFTDVGYGPNVGSIDFTDVRVAVAVPEPATWLMLALGLGVALRRAGWGRCSA